MFKIINHLELKVKIGEKNVDRDIDRNRDGNRNKNSTRKGFFIVLLMITFLLAAHTNFVKTNSETEVSNTYETNATTAISNAAINKVEVTSKTIYDKTYDWKYNNTISYKQKENTILFSHRNMSSVIKIDCQINKLVPSLSTTQKWDCMPYEKFVPKPIEAKVWHNKNRIVYEIIKNPDNAHKPLGFMKSNNKIINIIPLKLKENSELGKSAIAIYAVNEKRGIAKQPKCKLNTHYSMNSNLKLFQLHWNYK